MDSGHAETDFSSGLSHVTRDPICLKHVYGQLDFEHKELETLHGIKRFRYLQSVNISHNKLSSLAPLASLQRLTSLDASHNRLLEALDFETPLCSLSAANSQGDEELGSQLEVANLSHNRIAAIRDLKGHSLLRELNLSNNCIQEIQGLDTLKYLRELVLDGNLLREIQGLDGLPLQSLSLRKNRINSLKGLGKLPRLQKLDVGENLLFDLYPLKECLQLCEIKLDQNKITSIKEAGSMSQLANLQALLLLGNPICKEEFYRLRVIKQLQKLVSLDEERVSAEEKVKALNLQGMDVEMRKAALAMFLPEEEFQNHLPPFQETHRTFRELNSAMSHQAAVSFIEGLVPQERKVQQQAEKAEKEGETPET